MEPEAIAPTPQPIESVPLVNTTDPLLDEIRAIKESVSKRFDHDVDRMCDHLEAAQQRHRGRLIRRGAASPAASNLT